jgi:import inner membrane translocase subunit TIM22
MERFNERLSAWANDPRNVESIRESCPFNVVTHGAMGFAFGGFLGMFLASMSAGGTSPESQLLNPSKVLTEAIPLRLQVRHALTDLIKKSWSSAKNFGTIAALYSGSECIVEGVHSVPHCWSFYF